MRNFLFILIVVFNLTAFAAVRTTVQPGDFSNTNIWDCGCIPTTTDDIIVQHDITHWWNIQLANLTITSTGSISSTGVTYIIGAIDVQAGGLWDTQDYVFAYGDYNIDGTHRSSAYILLDSNTDQFISGTGVIDLDSWFISRYSDKYILAGSDLTMPSGYGFYMWTGTGTVYNFGKIRMNWLGGINSANWTNDVNSVLDITRYFFGNFSVDARANGNEVIWSGDNQTLGSTVNSEYYNLTLRASDIGFTKFLSENINILNDVNIENAEFDANNFNIQVKGDWIDTDGRFDPTSTRVTFNGVNQEISATSGLETFNDMDISSTSMLRLNTGIRANGTIQFSTSFLAQGYGIDAYGDWVNNGTYVHGDNTVRMRGNSPSVIRGDTEFYNLRILKGSGNCTNMDNIYIRSTLGLESGAFNTNDNVVLLSDISGTARLDRVTGGATMSGDITVQRYLETTTNDWHLLGSPVAGMQLSDWDDDLLTTGFPGSDYPAFYFNNATYYDETYLGHKDEGILNASNITDGINVGQGWRMYLPADVTTMDVKGPANIGTVNIPVSYTASGSVWDDGWNLVANPYASTIDWNSVSGWTKSGLNNAIYVWNPANSQYTTYVGGVGTNGGSRYIPSTQAFWVHASNASASLTILEDAKSANDPAFKEVQNSADYFKMIITSEFNFSDEVAIRTSENATDGFDKKLDAIEISSATVGVPSLSAVDQDDLNYSIYSFAHSGEEKIIPLDLNITFPGVYKISFENLYQFNDYSCLVLYDSQMEETYLITPESSFTLDLEEAEYAERFFIKVCPPLYASKVNVETIAKKKLSDLSLSSSEDNIQIIFDEQQSSQFEITVNDILGRRLSTDLITMNGNSRVQIDRVQSSAGIVIVVIHDLKSNSIEAKRIYLN